MCVRGATTLRVRTALCTPPAGRASARIQTSTLHTRRRRSANGTTAAGGREAKCFTSIHRLAWELFSSIGGDRGLLYYITMGATAALGSPVSISHRPPGYQMARPFHRPDPPPLEPATLLSRAAPPSRFRCLALWCRGCCRPFLLPTVPFLSFV